MVLGDLNATAWCYAFRRFLRETGLKDSARGWGYQATWPTGFLPLRIPIDHCLLSPDLKVLNRRIGPNVGSDHFPLTVELALGP